jgi:predicted nucleic acid-binding protein
MTRWSSERVPSRAPRGTFIDTNVLVYADDRDAGAKRRTAQEALGALIEAGEAVVSTQVLQEYFSIATRKLGLSAEAHGELYESVQVENPFRSGSRG